MCAVCVLMEETECVARSIADGKRKYRRRGASDVRRFLICHCDVRSQMSGLERVNRTAGSERK